MDKITSTTLKFKEKIPQNSQIIDFIKKIAYE